MEQTLCLLAGSAPGRMPDSTHDPVAGGDGHGAVEDERPGGPFERLLARLLRFGFNQLMPVYQVC
jgi:hypothetical protein